MRIAVTYDNGEVAPYFGRTEQFKMYDIEGADVLNDRVLDSEGRGLADLVGFLAASGVDALICDGLGDTTRGMLADEGIEVYSGVQGEADMAVGELLEGTLEYDMG